MGPACCDAACRPMPAALAQWPSEGIPRDPGAWLMSTAKHRATDVLRRGKILERKHTELGLEAYV